MGFRFRRANKQGWSRVYSEDEFQRGLRLRLLPHRAPFHITNLATGVQGPGRSRSEVIKRMNRRAKHSSEGDGWEVSNERGYRLRIRHVHSGLDKQEPGWAPTYLRSTNANVNGVAEAAYAYDEDVDCLGTRVCKRISGTNTWSQHAYGNAIDLAFRVPPPVGFDLNRQQKLAEYLGVHGDELSIQTILHRDQAWVRGRGWAKSNAAYHTHVHVDCYPPGVGYPSGC